MVEHLTAVVPDIVCQRGAVLRSTFLELPTMYTIT